MSRKERNRERRRVEGLIDEAFEALDRGQRDLAARLARRAGEAGPMNPRVLLDCARILQACGVLDEADDVLRAVIAQAPDFAEAFAALADLQASRGRLVAAVRLQARAVALLPDDDVAAELLAELRGRLGESEGDEPAEPAAPSSVAPALPSSEVEQHRGTFAARLARVSVDELAEALIAHGSCRVKSVLEETWRRDIGAVFGSGDGMDREWNVPATAGSASHRFYLEPLPAVVAGLREALWSVAAALGARLATALGDTSSYPGEHAVWLDTARRRGRHREAARLVRLGADAQTEPWRDEDRRAFPLRAVVDLGNVDGAAAGEGTAVVLTDRRPGKKVRQHRASTTPGDVVLFAVRDRLSRVGGVFGLQPIAFSFGPFPAERLVLDLPFEGDG